MPYPTHVARPESFLRFGELLKYLRKRAQLTQRELARAVNYSEVYLSRIESNQRVPDPATILALFVPALELEHEPEFVARLMDLAANARGANRTREHTTFTSTARSEKSDELGVLESIPVSPSTLIDRPAVHARLRTTMAETRCIALCGLPGVGKTALAAEMAREYARTQPVFWLTLTAGVTTSFDAVLRQLALFFLAEGDQRMTALLDGTAQRDTPLPIKQQIMLLVTAASQRTVLLCLDNVHLIQADASLLELLRLVTTTSASLLLISRESIPLPAVEQVVLRGLEHPEGLSLIGQLMPTLEPVLADRLVRRTDGSPMLLRLALGQLRDQQHAPEALIDHLETEPHIATYLPDTVLRQLDASAWRLVSFIAIFRRPINVYDEALIEASQSVDGTYDLNSAIAELQRRHLIDHPARATLHPLIQAHIHTLLSGDIARRRRLHRIAGEWSEGEPDGALEAAYHYGHAGELELAADVLVDQGEILHRNGQVLAAAEVVDELLARARRRKRDELVGRLLVIRGDLLIHTVRAAEAEADYRQALTGAPEPAVRAQIATRLALSLIQRGGNAEGLQLCQESADLAAGIPTLAQLAAIECWAHLQLARYDDVERVGSRALTLADQLAATPRLAAEVRARTHNALGIALHINGDSAALGHWQQAVTAARIAGLLHIEYRALVNIGILHYQQRNVERALRFFNEALITTRAIGDSCLTGRILHNIGYVQTHRGELAAALRTLEEACILKRQMGDQQGLATSENSRAWVLIALGDVGQAQALVEHILAETEETGDLRLRAIYMATLAITRMIAGENVAAEAILRSALALPGIEGDAKLMSDVYNYLALSLLAQRSLNAAQDILNTELPADIGLEGELDRLLLIAMAAMVIGDTHRALIHIQRVDQQAQSAGYGLYVQTAGRLLAAIDKPLDPMAFPRLFWVQDGRHL